jgi:hypothetical protein
MIPRLLHQMWLDRELLDTPDGPPEKAAPNGDGGGGGGGEAGNVESRAEKYRRYRRSWTLRNPDLKAEPLFWDRRQIEALWATEPRLAPWRDFFFNGLQRHIERCDFSRYALMWIYGGLYADLDLECVGRIPEWLWSGAPCWLVLEPETHSALTRWPLNWSKQIFARKRDENEAEAVPIYEGPPRLMSNSFLASRPGHPFWKGLMDYIQQHYCRWKIVYFTTGPCTLYRFWCLYQPEQRKDQDRVALLPTPYVFPFDDRGRTTATNSSTSSTSSTLPFASTRWKEGSNWGAEDAWNHYGFALTIIVLVMLLTAAVIAGAILLFSKNSPNQKPPTHSFVFLK